VGGAVSYLLDTNIISENCKPKVNPGVVAFLLAADPSAVFICVLTIGELRKGIVSERLKDGDTNAAQSLASWLEGFELSFADRILDVARLLPG
jgi:toxin FitB